MPLECLAQKLLGGSKIAPLTEPEVDGVTITVDGSVEIFPLAADFEVCFVSVLLGSDGSLSPIEPLQQFG